MIKVGKKFFLPNRIIYICKVNKKQRHMNSTGSQNQEVKDLDTAYDEQSRKLYDHIMEMGVAAFDFDNALHKYRESSLLKRLISHFESKEEYEKCAGLKEVLVLLEKTDF
jgi:hypothetical protein